jgi:uncharacterized protein DUF262
LDPVRRKTVREVVDGQQRLQTILDYLEDRSVVLRSHNDHVGGKKFSELSEGTKRRILNYPFAVVILAGADDTDVFRTFERLNSYTLPLKAQEKLNAKYFGSFKQFVFKLGQDHLEFWRSNGILSNRIIVRMGEAELTSELIVAMLAGLQDKKKSLEKFYKDYDDAFPHAKRYRKEFEVCLGTIQGIFGEELRETPYKKKALFYSVFLVIYDLLFGMPDSPVGRVRVKIRASEYAAVRRNVIQLGGVLESEAPNAKEARFIEACARQTDNIGPRRIRFRYIHEAVVSAL